MKKKIMILFVAVLTFSLVHSTTIYASGRGVQAAQIARTLNSYSVSPEWAPDLKSNSDMLDELVTLINGFDAYDVVALGADKDLAIRYYTKYNEAIGVSAALPIVFDAPEPSASRNEVLKILTSLTKGQVNPQVKGDIEANGDTIERMLMMVFAYTPEECMATTQSERESLTAYFAALYRYKGWDKSELDLLFSASSLPEQATTPLPQTNFAPPLLKQSIGDMVSSAQHSTSTLVGNNSPIISAALTLFIWVALLAGIIFLLKQRSDKKYFRS